jgi:hypothetical protein
MYTVDLDLGCEISHTVNHAKGLFTLPCEESYDVGWQD